MKRLDQLSFASSSKVRAWASCPWSRTPKTPVPLRVGEGGGRKPHILAEKPAGSIPIHPATRVSPNAVPAPKLTPYALTQLLSLLRELKHDGASAGDTRPTADDSSLRATESRQAHEHSPDRDSTH